MAKKKRHRGHRDVQRVGWRKKPRFTVDDPYPGLEIVESPGNYLYVCTLINPKDHRPVQVVWNRSSNGVRVGSPVDDPRDFVTAGRGYFDLDDIYDETECARTHTPGGVSVKGQALGTMLYSGMAVFAALTKFADAEFAEEWDFQDWIEKETEACVGSIPGNRSGMAGAFWRRAHETGLATAAGDGETCGTETAYVTGPVSYGVSEYDLEHVIEDSEEGWESIEGWDPDEIEGEVESEVEVRVCKTAAIDVIAAQKVFELGWVIHWNPLLDHVANFSGKEIPAEVLLGMNLRGVRGASFVAFMIQKLTDLGVPWDTLSKFIRRNVPPWFAGEDPLTYKGKVYPGHKKKNPRQGPLKQTKAWNKFFGKYATGSWA